MNEPEKESEKQQGFSKEAWTAIGIIVAALITGIASIIVNLIPSWIGNNSSPPSSSSSSSNSRKISVPSPSARRLLQNLEAVNIDFSNPNVPDWLNDPSSRYPQFAEGCLNFLDNQRLKQKVYIDVIFWKYTGKLGGEVIVNSYDGNLDAMKLKNAIVKSYEERNGNNNLSFENIVEPKP